MRFAWKVPGFDSWRKKINVSVRRQSEAVKKIISKTCRKMSALCRNGIIEFYIQKLQTYFENRNLNIILDQINSKPPLKPPNHKQNDITVFT